SVRSAPVHVDVGALVVDVYRAIDRADGRRVRVRRVDRVVTGGDVAGGRHRGSRQAEGDRAERACTGHGKGEFLHFLTPLSDLDELSSCRPGPRACRNPDSVTRSISAQLTTSAGVWRASHTQGRCASNL